jgi:hypothetical protein
MKGAQTMSSNVNLASLFNRSPRTWLNQQTLNQADGYNQDHGDNMVKTFQTITKAVRQKQRQGSSDSAAMAYAARKISKSSSASAQLYAKGLNRAAAQFQGKKVDERSGLQLLQALISGGQTPAANPQTTGSGDMLGALLGGLTGGAETQTQQGGQAAGGDMLGALLGGLTGGTETQPQQGGNCRRRHAGGIAGRFNWRH